MPASVDLAAKLRVVRDGHAAAVKCSDIAQAFRANIAFHATLFKACGNLYFAEAIAQFALKSHGVRFYCLMRPDFLERARQEYEAMIDAFIKGNHARLVALCKAHIHSSAPAYTETSQPEIKMGFAALPAHAVTLRIAGWFLQSAHDNGSPPARISHRWVRISAGQGRT